MQQFWSIEEDTKEVIKCCHENNIMEFIISSNSNNMISSVMALSWGSGETFNLNNNVQSQ